MIRAPSEKRNTNMHVYEEFSKSGSLVGFLRAPYYLGDPMSHPNLENYPYIYIYIYYLYIYIYHILIGRLLRLRAQIKPKGLQAEVPCTFFGLLDWRACIHVSVLVSVSRQNVLPKKP